MLRTDNKPLLEQIVGTHQNSPDDESKKLTQRANKIMQIMRDTKNKIVWKPQHAKSKAQTNDKKVSFRQEPQEFSINTRPSKVVNHSTSRKVQSSIPTGVKQTMLKEEEDPDFYRPTRDFKQIEKDSRVSQTERGSSVRLSLSRVLDIHQIIKSGNQPRNSRISSQFAEESIDKLEKSIENIDKQLKQIKQHQKKTDEQIDEIRIQKLEDEIQKLSNRNSIQLQTQSVERVKTIKIDIKKATVPITLRTSRKAVVVQIEKPRAQPIQHRCNRNTSSNSVRNSVESVKSSRVASRGYGQQPHKPPQGSYQIAKRKPLLTTRIAEKSMHQ